MNIFVLSTGRCGTVTFAKACGHVSNYTVGHETLGPLRRALPDHIASEFIKYPPDHIEVDNRLSWFLGTLDKAYGNDAFYVHLTRRRDDVARSYLARGWKSILFSFVSVMLQYYDRAYDLSEEERYQLALLYVDSVNENIRHFLRDKSHQIEITLENPKARFRNFWDQIGASGDLDSALVEWDIRHNQTQQDRSASWAFPDEDVHRMKNDLANCQERLRRALQNQKQRKA